MAYTQADLDAIRKIKASGMLSGELPTVGRVTYRSLAELKQIEADIQTDLNTASGTKRPRRVKIFAATKDL